MSTPSVGRERLSHQGDTGLFKWAFGALVGFYQARRVAARHERQQPVQEPIIATVGRVAAAGAPIEAAIIIGDSPRRAAITAATTGRPLPPVIPEISPTDPYEWDGFSSYVPTQQTLNALLGLSLQAEGGACEPTTWGDVLRADLAQFDYLAQPHAVGAEYSHV